MKLNSLKAIEYVLRLAVFMTFSGHGIVAFQGNAGWLGYLLTAGFSLENANDVLPLIGVLDMVVALIILLKPFKYVILWAVIWAFSTALIRPLSGEPVWAFVERGANWGAPLALFLLLLYQKDKISE